MFTWLFGKIRDLVGWVYSTLIQPIFNSLWTFVTAIIAVAYSLFTFTTELINWLVSIVGTAINGVAALFNVSQQNPTFGAAAQLAAFADQWVPLHETLAMMSATLVLMGVALTIRFVKWLREFFLP